ncbi:guided entry of tail-anchored proteins factor 1 isoform X2 [Physeter macrocephalus]|uniref:Guided entry of tail-anchored proteins factor 1 n=1 Tax=Physeter macrocephalus TaxID=9755 RepID=A0A9W2WT09_PHYMC|nr:guided entry of tail-anchored proteins factor 1 isoform X2 [Physeter catodon]
MSAAEADRWAWLLVLSFVFGCNVLRILLPSFSSFMSRVLQKDVERESQMRAEIQGMRQELSTVNMMDEFARYARLERKINKMTDKLKTHVKARTAQLAKIKWVISVAFYILQAALMVTLIWTYYSVPVAVVPSRWITPLDRLVAFPTGVAGSGSVSPPHTGLAAEERTSRELTCPVSPKCEEAGLQFNPSLPPSSKPRTWGLIPRLLKHHPWFPNSVTPFQFTLCLAPLQHFLLSAIL